MDNEPRGRAKPLALKDWAYQVLKEDILSLRLPPGTIVRVQVLSEKLDISRTPIREALLTLENEGLVRSEPRIGFFVTEITGRDLVELYELRALLESYAVQSAVPYVTGEDLDGLETALEASKVAVEQGEAAGFLEIDKVFHTLLLQRSPNRHLVLMMDSTEDLTHRLRRLGLGCLENVYESLVEHHEIIAALRRGDGHLAAQLMNAHLLAVKDRLLPCLNLPGEGPGTGPGV